MPRACWDNGCSSVSVRRSWSRTGRGRRKYRHRAYAPAGHLGEHDQTRRSTTNSASCFLLRRVSPLLADIVAEGCDYSSEAAASIPRTSLVAGGVRRVEREFGQKSFAARVAGRDLRKLYEVVLADGGILVNALEMRRVPAADEIKFGGPARRLPVHTLYGVNKGGPILRCSHRWWTESRPVAIRTGK